MSPITNLKQRWNRKNRPTVNAVQPDIFFDHPVENDVFSADQILRHAHTLAANPFALDANAPERLLDVLDNNAQAIKSAYRLTLAASESGARISPAAEWLLDNYFIVRDQITVARKHLPRRYSRELPRALHGTHDGLPRVYELAAELVIHTDSRLNLDELSRFVQAYQSVSQLTLGELWAIPIMLRLALISSMSAISRKIAARVAERQKATLWADRFLAVVHEKPKQLIVMLGDLARTDPVLTWPFVTELTSRLQSQHPGLSAVLSWIDHELAERSLTLEQAMRLESQDMAANQVAISNCITSFRTLSAIDWATFVEQHSGVEEALRTDPAGIYPKMAFTTRDQYRHAVERMARRSDKSQQEVALQAIDFARNPPLNTGHATSQIASNPITHVGWYLMGEGLPLLEKHIAYRPTFREHLSRFFQRHSGPLYTLGALWVTLTLVALIAASLALRQAEFSLIFIVMALAILPASQSALSLLNWVTTLIVWPKPLPRMDFSHGVPNDHRTVVAIPMFLSSHKAIADALEGLEVKFLSNADPNIRFALLSDFPDACQEALPADGPLLKDAITGIQALNQRHGTGEDVFFLFHRPRLFNPSENCWMGRERKRGKVGDFNQFLLNGDKSPFTTIVGNFTTLPGSRHIVVLDADTQLTPESVPRLIGTMAHPLNRPVFDPLTGRIIKGYGILQPRVSVNLASAGKSRYARLFSQDAGLDPYTREVSNVYHDLFGEASFIGKGALDAEAFHRSTSQSFPDNAILSHDLIEGAFARCGFASDVELLEDAPSRYLADVLRRHRWTRGDWQILPWLLPTVPAHSGRGSNPLSLLSRWKVFDNLRRSLVPALTLCLFLIAFVVPDPGWWVVLVAVLVAWVPALNAVQAVIAEARVIRLGAALRRQGISLAHIALGIILLPHEAFCALDAIGKVVWRKCVSGRKLLEWQVSTQVEAAVTTTLHGTLWAMRFSVLAGAALLLAAWHSHSLLSAAGLLGVLWATAPILAWWLSQPLSRPQDELDARQARFVGTLARRTWRFFERFSNDQTHALAPDNFQERPAAKLAERTSPTNIGLGALSALAAWDMGYLATTTLIDKTDQTLTTMGQMERVRGHFLNWYDTRTLAPMNPQFVSTVDSGNLCASLKVLSSGLADVARGPILPATWAQGLQETVLVLIEDTTHPNPPLPHLHPALTRMHSLLNNRPRNIAGAKALLTELSTLSQALNPSAHAANSMPREDIQWAIQNLQNQCRSLLDDIALLAPADPLPEPDLARLAALMQETSVPQHQAQLILASLNAIPTLTQVAAFHDLFTPCASVLIEKSQSGPNAAFLSAWLRTAIQTSLKSAQAARKLIDRITFLQAQCEHLSTADFTFLFDDHRKLFSIGFHADQHRMDPGFYDLLASEARIASYLAIAQGQVPLEHWFHLGRNITPAGKGVSLISWSGSMFEYLMAPLIMPDLPGTLLHEACQNAIAEQISQAKAWGIPWGVSESGYNLVDSQMNYQYRAFGVPALGLQRALPDDRVVAPYATAMALLFDPAASNANLHRLAALGAVGPYGLYEAVDYTTARVPDGKTCEIVSSYMAHHSGMALLAFVSALRGKPMQRRFMAIPEFKAMESLLHERSPRPLREAAGTSAVVPAHPDSPDTQQEKDIPLTQTFSRPDPKSPRVALLGNGRYRVVLTETGSGQSSFNELALTRWNADPTFQDQGLWAYITDDDSGLTWPTTWHPNGPVPKYWHTVFAQGRVEYTRVDNDIEVHTQVAVSPQDDLEVRRVRITNLSNKNRRIRITTYTEPVIAPQSADQAHRAFSNLFVQTSIPDDSGALLATRRPRGSDETPPWLFHRMTIANPAAAAFQNTSTVETDRLAFQGRLHASKTPQALAPRKDLGNSSGSILDPVLSIQKTLEIPAGTAIDLDFVLGIAPTRDAAVAHLNRYAERRFSDHVFEAAWTHAQILQQQLGVQPADILVFNRLAGALVFNQPVLRARPGLAAQNKLGQNALWGHAISGDLPILLFTLSSHDGIPMFRTLLRAHAWWRHKGLLCDLIVLVDEPGGYRQDLLSQASGELAASVEAPLAEKNGGVFIKNAQIIPDDQRLLLAATARVSLSDKAGSLEHQASRQSVTAPAVPLFEATSSRLDNSPVELKRNDLAFDNGFGGFTADGKEYVIRLKPGQPTPAPWANVLANGVFGSVVTESGSAYTWFENAHEFRLTPWHNDPIADTSGEALYLRDESTGAFWSPTPQPAPGKGDYLCRHGMGYTVYEHQEGSLFSETTAFVAYNAPVKFILFRLENRSDEPKRISLWGCFDWTLGETRDKTRAHIIPRLDPVTGALIAQNTFNADFASWTAFANCYGAERTTTSDRAEFFGLPGSRSKPAALARQRLSNRTGPAADPCAGLQCTLDIPPRQERYAVFILGAGHDLRHAQELLLRHRGIDSAKQALSQVWEFWKKMLSAVQVQTPEPALDVLVNQWMPYQVLSARLWGRSGFYQSGGAFGFRDQLQDTMSLLHTAPWLIREQLLASASHQFKEGDVQHWWHPPLSRGVRTRFSDDYLWLPFVAAFYVQSTGDTGVLDQSLPFLQGRQLREHEEAYYDLPQLSPEQAPLYDHCVRAIKFGLKFGSHGLPLMGAGDWNDGMNRVGIHGKGESVWLAFFLYDVMKSFIQIATLKNDQETVTLLKQSMETLQSNIEKNAWDGNWYKRAFFDDGSPMGSHENVECKIDSIAQSWAVLSGAADPQKAAQGMESVAQHLMPPDLNVIKLFDPAFDQSSQDPGYIKGYVPGVRENGGQYTHAAIWAAMAFAKLGDKTRLWDAFHRINPIYHAKTHEDASLYKIEPYVIAADIYTNPKHAGRGGWSWYTGSAGWMYRLMLESMLGITLTINRLTFNPCLPPDWKNFKIHYRFRTTTYHLHFHITGVAQPPRITLDGQSIDTPHLTLIDDQKDHHVHIDL